MKPMEKIKLAFFGTPQFATYALDELERAGLTPALVVTQPDKPAERGLQLKAPPVKEWADARGIPVIQPENLKSGHPELEKDFDVFVVGAYGKMLPQEVLAIPRRGTLNIHPSLLPRYRGPSPIETAILDDAKETGVSIILLDEETDHGPVLAQERIVPEAWPRRRNELEKTLWRTGGTLLAQVIPQWVQDSLHAEPQDHARATFTKKIEKENGLVDLSGDAYKNYLKFCAYEGWPGTYFFTKRNDTSVRVKIVDAKYENEVFTPTRVIPEGKKEMNYEDFLRGV